LSHRLAATRPEGSIESSLSDSELAVTVTLHGNLSLCCVDKTVEFTLDRGWVAYRGYGLGSSKLRAAHLGLTVVDIHNRLATHFRHAREGLSAFRLTVGRSEIIFTSPRTLTDRDCKVVFEAVADQFPCTPRLAAV